MDATYRRYAFLLCSVLAVFTLGYTFYDSVSEHALDDPLSGTYTFPAPVLDIAATSSGTILVTVPPDTIKEISTEGIAIAARIPVTEGALVNGVAAAEGRSFKVATGGLDLGAGAALWEVTDGNVEQIADIHRYETENDPDAFAGSKWKHTACEEDSLQGFTAGPQSNPYHLAQHSSGTLLVADAAGNTLLSSDKDGNIDWVAIFEPPLDNEDEWGFFRKAEGNIDVDCYIQPVPTDVAIGPDGAYYVGELTGMPAAVGWSRLWRIAPDARNVVCPSDDCKEVLSGLTSVADLEFGPDGRLYVVEMDRNGWLAAVTQSKGGGRIKGCDLETSECTVIFESDMPISAIAFDKWDQMWVAENETLMGEGTATVRTVELD